MTDLDANPPASVEGRFALAIAEKLEHIEKDVGELKGMMLGGMANAGVIEQLRELRKGVSALSKQLAPLKQDVSNLKLAKARTVALAGSGAVGGGGVVGAVLILWETVVKPMIGQ